jgi:hypothetical protein
VPTFSLSPTQSTPQDVLLRTQHAIISGPKLRRGRIFIEGIGCRSHIFFSANLSFKERIQTEADYFSIRMVCEGAHRTLGKRNRESGPSVPSLHRSPSQIGSLSLSNIARYLELTELGHGACCDTTQSGDAQLRTAELGSYVIALSTHHFLQ